MKIKYAHMKQMHYQHINKNNQNRYGFKFIGINEKKYLTLVKKSIILKGYVNGL